MKNPQNSMDYTKQLSPQNYELHEDRGDRMNNALNVLRQNDIMTGRDWKLWTIGDFNVLRQKDIMT